MDLPGLSESDNYLFLSSQVNKHLLGSMVCSGHPPSNTACATLIRAPRGLSWRAHGPPARPPTPPTRRRQNRSLRWTYPARKSTAVETRCQMRVVAETVVMITYQLLRSGPVFLIEIAKCEIRRDEEGVDCLPPFRKERHPSSVLQSRHPGFSPSIRHSIVA
jgi:hypothetical protein